MCVWCVGFNQVRRQRVDKIRFCACDGLVSLVKSRSNQHYRITTVSYLLRSGLCVVISIVLDWS